MMRENNKNTKIDKYYCNGVVDILLHLFFERNNNFNEFNTLTYTQSTVVNSIRGKLSAQNSNAMDIYAQQVGSFEPNLTINLEETYNEEIKDKLKKLNIDFTKEELEMKGMYFSRNIFDLLEDFLFKSIISLMSLNYVNIMYPQEILNKFIDVQLGFLPFPVNATDYKVQSRMNGGLFNNSQSDLAKKCESYKAKYLNLKNIIIGNNVIDKIRGNIMMSDVDKIVNQLEQACKKFKL